MKSKSWLGVLAIVFVALGITYLEVLALHWAVNLFTPITMAQAFGIIIILNVLSIPFRSRNK